MARDRVAGDDNEVLRAAEIKRAKQLRGPGKGSVFPEAGG